MAAPKKIYVVQAKKDKAIYSARCVKLMAGDIPYIRQDLLEQWIREESKSWYGGDTIFKGLIEKINSL